MGYLICSKCKSYHELQSGESPRDLRDHCPCGGKLRYVENLDIVDPRWMQIIIPPKRTKGEVLREKIGVFSLENLKTRLNDFWNKCRYRLQSAQNWDNHTYYDTGMNPLNAIKNELNLGNIRWTLVIPVIVAITLILTFVPGILTLLTFVLLVALGYTFNNQIIGAKNALIAGAISFLLGSLFSGSFLLLIPYTLLGVINGAVCGWIGGYLRNIRFQRRI
ncbi:hypothetical protein DSECCO2_285300 [anaerobic digester metagenome]